MLSKQIQKNKEIQLNEKWDNPLENPKVVSRIDNLSSRLTEIAEEKDQILESPSFQLKKYNLGDYRWQTYEDVDYMADYLGRGLRSLDLKHGQNICIFAVY